MIRSLLLTLLFVSTPAYALSCDEILNMANVHVPSNIIIQTMENSGSKFTEDDVRCLSEGGAPADIVNVARNLAGGSTGPVPVPSAPVDTTPADDDPGFNNASTLGAGIDDTEEAGGNSPARVEQLVEHYRNKHFLTASKGFFDLLEENAYPAEEAKIQYHLAKSLYELGMYHSAQYYFMEVVRRGPANPSFKYALPYMVRIAQRTGNDYELLRVVHKIPPESFPRHAKTQLHYLMGRKKYEDEELTAATKYFQQVSSKSDLYVRALYFDGVIANERGKLRSAVKSFRDVYQQKDIALKTNAQVEEVGDLQDLALVNIARIYFGVKDYEKADFWYSQVDRTSKYWAESLFERGWTKFWLNDLNHTLGLLLTVKSPYYSENDFLPEAEILRALTFFNLCHYDEVERTLIAFEDRYRPMVAESEAFLDQYKSKENRQLADQAYDTYFDRAHPKSQLDQALFARVLRNRDLGAFVTHLDMMEKEVKAIDTQKAVWRDTIGDQLKQVIEKDRQRYKRRAGLILLKEMAQQQSSMKDLLVQSEIIRFEVVDAERADYEYKMSTAEVLSSGTKKIDFATSKEIIYWPFNGEFWADELGYYHYAEHDECR
jgi:tetratricopeptide (TPR) repeat protein